MKPPSPFPSKRVPNFQGKQRGMLRTSREENARYRDQMVAARKKKRAAKVMGIPKSSKSLDHDLVLKAMVTSGSPILGNLHRYKYK